MHEKTKARLRELQRLTKKNGGVLTAEAVEKFARNAKTACHDYFEWDDSVAGHLYRLDQARTLIRGMPMRIRSESAVRNVPGYVVNPDKESHEQGYMDIREVKSDAEKKVGVLIDEFDRVRAALKRARAIAEYFDLGDKFDGFVSEIDALERDFYRDPGGPPGGRPSPH